MWNVTYDLKKNIFPEKKGYQFVKSINLFIPHREIGLNVLVRKEQQINLFNETILKLIDNKCNSIANIAELTGVEEEIVIDVVGGMANLDLVYLKSGLLILTPRGEEVLKTLKETIIEKEEVNRIIINAINGKITEVDHSYSKPNVNCASLDEKIKIQEEFILKNFEVFNEFYQKRQEDLDVGEFNGINEIYQILSKSYEKLCYIMIKTYIYENLKDNDIIFDCESDKDNNYATILASQVHYSTGARNFLKNKFEAATYIDNPTLIDNEKERKSEELIQFIRTNKSDKLINNDEFDKKYFTERYLIENEYIDILLSLPIIRPTEIFILSNDLSEILSDSIITSIQQVLTNFNTKLTIICNKQDRKGLKLKNKIIDQNQKKKKIMTHWVEKDILVEESILLFPYCIMSKGCQAKKFDNDYLIKEFVDISFDKEKINGKYKEFYSLI